MLPLMAVVLAMLLPVAAVLAVPPPGAEVDVIDYVTYLEDPTINCYFLLTVQWDDGELHTETIPSWCADSTIFFNPEFDTYVLPTDGSWPLPEYATDDEQWNAINYLMYHWQIKDKAPYNSPDCTWAEIQQTIWVFADEGYVPSVSPSRPAFDADIVSALITDVTNNMDEFEGPYVAYLLDPGDENQDGDPDSQLSFFTVPEVPLGTIASLATMVGAFVLNKKRL